MTLFRKPGAVPSSAGFEALPQPQIIEDVPDRHDFYLDEAPYEQAVNDAYAFSRDAIRSILLEGRMPGQTRLGTIMYEGITADHAPPPLEEFSDDILDLMPWYRKMQEAGMGPEPVFAPRTFNMNDWSALHANHPVPYGVEGRNGWTAINGRYVFPSGYGWEMDGLEEGTTWGVESNWLAGVPIRLGPIDGEEEAPARRLGSYDPLAELTEGLPDDGKDWDLVLVSGKNAPYALNVSSDGSKGRHHTSRMREFFGLSDDLTDEQAIALLSPGTQAYNALQWRRIATGTIPVDILTRTILRGNLSVDMTCSAGWHEDVAGVFLGQELASETHRILGVRPTLRAAELELLASPDIS